MTIDDRFEQVRIWEMRAPKPSQSFYCRWMEILHQRNWGFQRDCLQLGRRLLIWKWWNERGKKTIPSSHKTPRQQKEHFIALDFLCYILALFPFGYLENISIFYTATSIGWLYYHLINLSLFDGYLCWFPISIHQRMLHWITLQTLILVCIWITYKLAPPK